MPKSALPKHLQDSDWSGTDNASWLMRQKKKVQIWLAAGPRVPSGFFKWRDIPKTLLAIKGLGAWRWENTDGTFVISDYEVGTLKDNSLNKSMYLSRIQPWAKWGIVLQWPLFFNYWFIYRKKDVVSPPRYKSSFGITEMVTFGIGFKRDADRVFWLTCNIGGNFE